MSNRYKGGVISATPPTLVAGAGASGTWTLEQQMQATAAGLWPVNGPFYIEDVFSTWLYNGNSSTQTITNGIDLSGKGGLTWIKVRDFTYNHYLYDTARGVSNALYSNATDAQASSFNFASFDSTGFTLNSSGGLNNSSYKYTSWTFRKQPKFFDVVTTTSQTFSHSLASVAGCVIWKRTDASEDWNVVSRKSDGSYVQLNLNLTDGAFASYANAAAAGITSTTITLPSFTTGATYVAYLFAHNAGGFGLTGTDNVISCGSYTGSGSVDTVTLGYEPQWILMKATNTTGPWRMFDTMRGMSYTDNVYLDPSTSGAEVSYGTSYVKPTPTGFTVEPSFYGTGASVIYIAIRRGPMKVPTTGTSVFAPVVYTGNGATNTVTSNFPVDLSITKYKSSNGPKITAVDRLRGFGSATDATKYLFTSATDAEGSASNGVVGMDNTGLTLGSWSQTNFSSADYIDWMFKRAPSFFDEVCYTGNSTARTVNHNLGVAPELIIVKARSGTFAGNIDWFVYASPLGNSSRLLLNTTGALADGQTTWNSTTPTSSVFSLGTSDNINGTGYTYVAYLFATCAGVSKVGSYTGTATTLQIDCGFTAGSRFVLIKRTDSTGDWYVWDSARGIVAGNDPYLLLNSTAAEVTNTDYVDTYNAGFEISSTAPAAINANGGTYIFLAIA
jgi:hypothetical protein